MHGRAFYIERERGVDCWSLFSRVRVGARVRARVRAGVRATIRVSCKNWLFVQYARGKQRSTDQVPGILKKIVLHARSPLPQFTALYTAINIDIGSGAVVLPIAC